MFIAQAIPSKLFDPGGVAPIHLAPVNAFMNLCIKHWPALANMNNENRNIVMIGIKSFVECFEKLEG
jgi:hypothetical protein